MVATKALPRAPSTFGHQTRRNATPAELVDFFADLAEAEASIPDIPDEPTNGAVLDTCEDINSKTKESWEDSEVGDWFTIMYGTSVSSSLFSLLATPIYRAKYLMRAIK